MNIVPGKHLVQGVPLPPFSKAVRFSVILWILILTSIPQSAPALPECLKHEDQQELQKSFEYWKSTDLTLDFLIAGGMSAKTCLKNPEALEKCFTFANNLGQNFINPLHVLIKPSYFEEDSLNYKNLQVIPYTSRQDEGPFEIVRASNTHYSYSINPENQTLLTNKELQSEVERQIHLFKEPANQELLHQIIKDSQKKDLPFQTLLEIFGGKTQDDRITLSEGRLSDHRCFSSGSWLQGCFEAVNSIGNYTQPPTGLILRPELLPPSIKPPDNIKVLKSYGIFQFVEYVNTSQNPKNKTRTLKNIKRSKTEIELYAEKHSQELKVQKLFQDLAAQGLPPEAGREWRGLFIDVIEQMKISGLSAEVPESFIVGQAYNTLLSKALDPHSSLIPKKQFEEKETGKENQLVGIGISISNYLNNTYFVDEVFNGPALKSGVQPGDIILAVDDIPLQNFELAFSQILGKKGESLKLKCLRKNKIINFTITRDSIQLPTVEARTLRVGRTTVGYIKLNDFMDINGPIEVRNQIRTFNNSPVKGVILDLRGNHGGHIQLASLISSMFMNKYSLISILKNRLTQKIEKHSSATDISILQNYNGPDFDHETDLPLAILINAKSASAAEMTAAALQNYHRAWVIGKKSFGKGNAQEVTLNLVNNKIFSTITTDFFYHPNGETNQNKGVLPDFEVPRFYSLNENDEFWPREADLFANALQAEKMESQINPESMAKGELQKEVGKSRIESCIAIEQLAKTEAIKNPMADYQLLYAAEVLKCDPGNALVTGH